MFDLPPPIVSSLFVEARPTYNESAVQRKPMLLKSTSKFDESAEQQSLKDFLEDEEGGGRLDAMMIEDDFNIPVVLEEGQLNWSLNGTYVLLIVSLRHCSEIRNCWEGQGSEEVSSQFIGLFPANCTAAVPNSIAGHIAWSGK